MLLNKQLYYCLAGLSRACAKKMWVRWRTDSDSDFPHLSDATINLITVDRTGNPKPSFHRMIHLFIMSVQLDCIETTPKILH